MALILIADDTKLYRLGAKKILEDAGHEVLLATNGLEASKILASTSVDFLLSDIYMPEMDGYELILETNKKHPDVKIVAMTAGTPSSIRNNTLDHTKDDVLQTAGMFGADDTVEKPFSAETLLESVNACLSGDRIRPQF